MNIGYENGYNKGEDIHVEWGVFCSLLPNGDISCCLEYGNDWLTNLRGNSQFLPIHNTRVAILSHLEHFVAHSPSPSVCVAVFLFPPKSFHPCLEKQQISRRRPPPSRIPAFPLPLPNAARPRRALLQIEQILLNIRSFKSFDRFSCYSSRQFILQLLNLLLFSMPDFKEHHLGKDGGTGKGGVLVGEPLLARRCYLILLLC